MRARNKLNVKQVASLSEPNVYSDGGGLYLRIRPGASRSWLFVRVVGGKRREFGLGSALDVTLAEAQEKAASLRTAFIQGREPTLAKPIKPIDMPPAVTFGEFANEFIDSIERGFRNDKHRKQWRATIQTHATALLNVPLAEVSETDVLGVLKDIWLDKPETARRLRGRIERVLAAAKVKGLRSGENPAALKGKLELLLPRQPKQGASHHGALPFASLPKFMGQLRQRSGTGAGARVHHSDGSQVGRDLRCDLGRNRLER